MLGSDKLQVFPEISISVVTYMNISLLLHTIAFILY